MRIFLEKIDALCEVSGRVWESERRRLTRMSCWRSGSCCLGCTCADILAYSISKTTTHPPVTVTTPVTHHVSSLIRASSLDVNSRLTFIIMPAERAGVSTSISTIICPHTSSLSIQLPCSFWTFLRLWPKEG